jgi:cyclase
VRFPNVPSLNILHLKSAGRANGMCETMDRRELLRIALSGVGAAVAGGGLSLAGNAVAQNRAGSIAAVPLRDQLILLTGAGGNVVLLDRPGGSALVDCGAPEHAASLVDFVLAQTGRAPVELLFNTHWHLEHTGANELFGAAGAKIVAHESTKLWMSTEHYVDWQARTYRPRPAAALPTATFYSHEAQPIRATVGDERIEYAYLREAHTDGDIYVFFPEHNVLAAGGAVAAGAYPVLDYATGGWIGGLEDATRKLLEIADGETLIVPGEGPAQRRAHLEAQLEMIVTVRGRIEDLMRQGQSAEEMLAAGVTADFDARWGSNRDRFVSNVYNGLWWQGRLDGSL